MEGRQKTGMILLGVLGVVVVLAGCHKKVTPASAPAAAPEAGTPPSTPGAPVVSLTAEPSTVEKGQSVTLSWTSSNATEVDIEPNVGGVQATGSTNVTPMDSTTYVITAKGPGGTETQSARVTVTTAPPPVANDRAGHVEEGKIENELKDAYFDLDRSDIRPDAQQTLTADADALKGTPSASVAVEGHCDERGSEEYNLGLGDRRANAAKSFLINLGVPANRLSTISYGKDRPQCTESTEECWQMNRRVHLRLK